MDIFAILGQRLEERRKAVGLTQGEAAEAAGVAQTYVSNLENGHNRPGVVSLLVNLADQYETSLDYIFGRSEKPGLAETKRLSETARGILHLVDTLPGHRQEDLLVIADALLREEKRRYAFWLVVYCNDCDQPMVGNTREDDSLFYFCDNDECGSQTILETDLLDVVTTAVETLASGVQAVAIDGQPTSNSVLESVKNLGRRLGLLRARQQVQSTEIMEIVRDLLTHEDRSIPQAWLQSHFRIRVSDGAVSSVELL